MSCATCKLPLARDQTETHTYADSARKKCTGRSADWIGIVHGSHNTAIARLEWQGRDLEGPSIAQNAHLYKEGVVQVSALALTPSMPSLLRCCLQVQPARQPAQMQHRTPVLEASYVSACIPQDPHGESGCRNQTA